MKHKKTNKIYSGLALFAICICIGICIYFWIRPQRSPFQDGGTPPLKLHIQTVFILKENLPFLREWIVYHLNLGFDKFYLYDNTGSVGTDGSNKALNKYNIKFDDMVQLTDEQIKQEMDALLAEFGDRIVHIAWQPRDDKGNIVYGQPESIRDYIEKQPQTDDLVYTAFIDVDEFIISPDGIDLKSYVLDQWRAGVNKLIIRQKKFEDRYINPHRKVIDITRCIGDIDTGGWAVKSIINTKVADKKHTHIHTIGITEGTSVDVPEHVLRFNHYNVNEKQLDWMRGFFKRDDFTWVEDNTIAERYRGAIDAACGSKCSDKNNYIRSGAQGK